MRVVPQIVIGLICVIVVVQYRGVDAARLSAPMYFLLFLVAGSIASDAVMKWMRFLFGLAVGSGRSRTGVEAPQDSPMPPPDIDPPDPGRPRRSHESPPLTNPRVHAIDLPTPSAAVASSVWTLAVLLVAEFVFVSAARYVYEHRIATAPILLGGFLLLIGAFTFVPVFAGVYAARTVTRLRLKFAGRVMVSKIALDEKFGWRSITVGLAVCAMCAYYAWSRLA